MSSLAFVYVRPSPYLDLAVGVGPMAALCLGILVTWSPGGIDAGIQASLLQIYPILLSTLLSINRQALYLFDASYALLLTSSPLTIYLVVASICDICGFETNLYKRIKSHRRTIRILGILVPILWLGLSLTLRFSDRAFVDSKSCRGSSFKDWLLDFVRSYLLTSSITPGGGQPALVVYVAVPILAATFYLCMFRRLSQAAKDFRARRKGISNLWGRLCMPWTFMKCVWCVSIVVGPPSAKSNTIMKVYHRSQPQVVDVLAVRIP
jgi:hypothetical protein